MRRLPLAVVIVAASLGLSACGSGAKATIDQSVASLGSTADLQVHLTGTVSGAGMATARDVLKRMSMEVRFSNPSGAPLSQAAGKANAEFIFNVGSSPLVDLRVVDSNIYVMVDLSTLSGLPGIKLPSAQLALAQLVVGGRWFELTKSMLNSYLPSSAAAQAKVGEDQAVERKIIDAIVKVIDSTPATALANGGYTETGTLQSVVDAVLPTIESLANSLSSPGKVKGTYTLSLETSGSSATGASISITAPNGSKGDATVSLSATIAHASDGVATPSGATLITPALLQQLQSSAG
jgi:hypothetical protein